MIRSRIRRGAMMLSASTLALGVISAGVAVGSANASPPVPGVTSTNVTIGATVPLSGIAAGYAEVSAAANAVFKYVNAHGKVNGRTVTYIRLDDCYNLAAAGLGCTQPTSTTTLSQTTVLVGTDHVFATVGSLGTAAQDSVLSYMNSSGTPQLFVNSGSSDWNQPGTYPGLFGFQASYKVENKIFAKLIKSKYAGKKLGFIGQDDDFGANGYAGLTNGTGLSIASSDKVLYNAADAILNTGDILSGVTQLKNDSVKVVVLDSIPPVTAQILKTAHNLGYSPTWIVSSVGSNPVSVNTKYEAGITSFDSLPATNDTKNVWNVWLRKVLTQDTSFKGPDGKAFSSKSVLDGNEQYGAAFAVAFLEALKACGANPTQAGIIAAMTSTTFATPGILPLKYSASNHQGILGGVLSSILPNGSSAPKYVVETSHTVYTTTDDPSSAISTSTPYKVAAIPSWLK